jgi:hypothetical protein
MPCSVEYTPVCKATFLGVLKLAAAVSAVVLPWNTAGITPCVTTRNTSRADIIVAHNLLRR